MKQRSAVAFFFKHAGYSYNPRTETAIIGRWNGARQLAEAEDYAARQGWGPCWEPDPEPWDGDGEAPREVFNCLIRTESGEVLASLCGIGDPSPEYSRVVEAELALEARHSIEQSVMEAI